MEPNAPAPVAADPAERVAAALTRAFAWLFRHWLAVASLWSACLVLGAIATPWLAAHGWGAVAQLLYWAYRPLCPQRPDHSFFVMGHKMAFEQRETAMFVTGAAAGPLYLLLRRSLLRVPTPLMLASFLPMLVDITTQASGLRDGDAVWRVVTGAIATLGFALWVYPRFEADLNRDAGGPASALIPREPLAR